MIMPNSLFDSALDTSPNGMVLALLLRKFFVMNQKKYSLVDLINSKIREAWMDKVFSKWEMSVLFKPLARNAT